MTSDTNLVEALRIVLQFPSSSLRELHLSYNKLGESGVKQLCDELTHANCKLDKLDLSYNNLGHSGVKLLCWTDESRLYTEEFKVCLNLNY